RRWRGIYDGPSAGRRGIRERRRGEGRLRAVAQGKECGIDLWRPGVAGLAEIHLNEACRIVDGFSAFHQANLDALDDRFGGLLIDGRSILDEDGDELIAGRGSRVETKSLTHGRAYVGAFTRIASTSHLLGHVMIGEGAVIEPGTRIQDSVVMPGTYVGTDLDVRGAIVAPDCCRHRNCYRNFRSLPIGPRE
ncbi:MAG: hypothetical protein J0626_09100, partial [Rhodospirillaceae bacterium]|nr:hypothetical protein [Rhodospirillaceae bacterium]